MTLTYLQRRGIGWLVLLAALFVTFPARALTNLNVRLVSNVRPSMNPINYGDVWAENDIACLGVWLNYSGYNYGVGIYSISNPAAPALLSIYSPNPTSQNQFELGAVKNRIGYFGSWSGGGLHIVSLTNAASPSLLCRVGATTGNVTNGFDRVHTIWLERNYLYEAAHVAGIVSVKVFDISNPSLPVYLRDIVTTNTTKVHQITVRTKGAATILYTSGWGGNDDSNPASPGQTDIWDVGNIGTQPAQWLGRVYSGYNSHSSYPTPDGNTLVVCRETPGGDVKLYDISNPGTLPINPVPLVTITPASMGLEADIPHNPVVVSNYLFLSWYQNGIQIFDITDRSKPVRLGFYDTFAGSAASSYEGNWGVFPHLGFDKVLLSDIQSGLYVMDFTRVLVATNNYPPLIAKQPTSITVTQGTSATLAATVTGSLLNYQWRFNGAAISGATSNSLTLSNIQPGNAGSYSLVVSNASAGITSSLASVSVLIYQQTQTVYLEDFETASGSTNWNVFGGSTNGIPDYTVTWAYDYGTYFSSFNGIFIPSAPGSVGGTTKGVRLTVNNNDGTPSIAGVSLYPKSLMLTGGYTMKLDMWLNYPGGPGGGTGSTEFSTFGINHTGTAVNWDAANVIPSDGVWFAVDGEGGDPGGRDYRVYEGSASARPALLSYAASGLSASGAASANNSDPYFQGLFSSPAYETPGSPGKKWVQVEITQDANNLLTWRMNGSLIGQRVNTSPFTNGTLMIGYMDIFNSIASPVADAFLLFDNVRVEVPVSLSPGISGQPQNVSVYPLQDASFSVAATGGAPLSFQWRFNGTNVPGATANSYTRANVQAEDVGFYSVVVSNTYGSITSSNAALLLLDSPYISAVQATPGDHGALISWKTTLPASSQVQFQSSTVQLPSAMGSGAGFSQSSYLDPALTTNHVVQIAGLTPNTRYSYQVLSMADTNTYVSGVYQFTTLAQLPPGQTVPDWWRNFYFGGPTNVAADPDADGYTISQEYILGTNPTNRLSRLLLTAGKSGTNLQVTFWPTLGDRDYQLVRRSALSDPGWQSVNAVPSALPDGHGVFSVPMTNSVRSWYRLNVQLFEGAGLTGLAIPVTKSYSPYASDPICGPNRAYVR
jgi:hypothetical protein